LNAGWPQQVWPAGTVTLHAEAFEERDRRLGDRWVRLVDDAGGEQGGAARRNVHGTVPGGEEARHARESPGGQSAPAGGACTG
jgi:hypothetical protein